MNWPYLMWMKKRDEAIDVLECVVCTCHSEDAVDDPLGRSLPKMASFSLMRSASSAQADVNPCLRCLLANVLLAADARETVPTPRCVLSLSLGLGWNDAGGVVVIKSL